MNHLVVFMGALLAAPLFSQAPAKPAETPQEAEIKWLLQVENRAQVQQRLGPARQTGESGDFLSLQYQFGVADHDDYSHIVVFRKSTGALVSFSRNFDPEIMVDQLFPARETSVHYFPDSNKPQFTLRLRRLSGGRLLMAMGSPKPGVPTGQLLVMMESELRNFYPWVKDQLDKAASKSH